MTLFETCTTRPSYSPLKTKHTTHKQNNRLETTVRQRESLRLRSFGRLHLGPLLFGPGPGPSRLWLWRLAARGLVLVREESQPVGSRLRGLGVAYVWRAAFCVCGRVPAHHFSCIPAQFQTARGGGWGEGNAEGPSSTRESGSRKEESRLGEKRLQECKCSVRRLPLRLVLFTIYVSDRIDKCFWLCYWLCQCDVCCETGNMHIV